MLTRRKLLAASAGVMALDAIGARA